VKYQKAVVRFVVLLLGAMVLSLSACGDSSEESTGSAGDNGNSSVAVQSVDLDLTQLSSTMVYSEVYNIMMDPESYVGKIIRMDGQCLSAYYDPTESTYYSIVIQDATACCAQGIEYVLSEGVEYPADDTTATVVGRFEPYEEDGTTWYHLVDAVLEA